MAIQPQQNQIDLLSLQNDDGTNPLDLPESDAPILDNEDAVQVAGLVKGIEFLVQAGKRVKTGTANKEALKEIAKQNEAEIARLKKVQEDYAKKRQKEIQDLDVPESDTKTVMAADGQPVDVPANTPVTVIEPPNQPKGVVATKVVVETPEPEQLVRPKLDPAKVNAVMKGEVPETELLDIDWAKVNQVEDFDVLTARVQEVFADEIFAAKRGVLSDAEVLKLASQLDMSKDLLTRKVGVSYSAEQLRASGLVVEKAKQEWVRLKDELLDLAQQGKDDLALAAEFKAHTDLTSALMINLKGAKAEAGRALRAARNIPKNADGEIDIVALNAQIKEVGGVDGIKNMAKMVGELTSPEQSRFFSRLGTYNKIAKEAYMSAWYSSVLSSTVTFARALFGSLDMMLVRPVDSFFGATIGRAIDESISVNSTERMIRQMNAADPMGIKIKPSQYEDDFVDITESAILISGIFQNSWNGLKAGARAFKTGDQVYGFGLNTERVASDAISATKFADPESLTARTMGFIGKVNSIPQRGMMFVDEFAASITYEGELRALAARRAAVNIRNGMDPEEAKLLMIDSIVNPSSADVVTAQNAAKEVSLRADLGPIGNWMMKTRSQMDNWNLPIPVGTVNFAFLKTVINLEKNTLRHTPLSPLLGDVRDDIVAGGARRQMALGRLSTGMALAGTAYNLTLNGYVTGLGPADYQLKKMMQEQDNWQPCSVKGGDGKYHSIAGLGPIAQTVCMGATIAENVAVYGKAGSEDQEDILAVTGIMFARHLQEIPMLGQTGALLGLIESIMQAEDSSEIEDELAKFTSEYTKNMVGGVIPVPMPASSLLRQLERTIDPATRSVSPDPGLSGDERYIDFLFRSWAVNTPMMSDMVEPRRNILAEPYMPMTSNGLEDFAINTVTPFLTSYRKADAMQRKYLDYSIARGKPIFNDISKSVNGIRLSDNEHSNLKVYMNDIRLNVNIGGSRFSNVTLREAFTYALQVHGQEAEEGRFNGLATSVSGVVSQFKAAALEDPRFQSKYPEAYRQIKSNEQKVKDRIDPVRRRPVTSDEDESVLDLRQLLEPTR
jgi:hypothetical protein